MNKILSDTERAELIKAAREARKNSYSPYSHFRVGAAILFENGDVVSGCNVENASFGLSLCAERKPIAAAIVGKDGEPCAPCGACRQFLAEFSPEMEIILEDGNGFKIFKLRELLPEYFSPANIAG
ncbi:MAG: cytidine deaminase [Synergistaceae bacterium]|nr:cytidine deaminase [Synergistaceae bacterium]